MITPPPGYVFKTYYAELSEIGWTHPFARWYLSVEGTPTLDVRLAQHDAEGAVVPLGIDSISGLPQFADGFIPPSPFLYYQETGRLASEGNMGSGAVGPAYRAWAIHYALGNETPSQALARIEPNIWIENIDDPERGGLWFVPKAEESDFGILALVALAGGAIIFGPAIAAFAGPELGIAATTVTAGETVVLDVAWETAFGTGWTDAVVTSSLQNAALAAAAGDAAAAAALTDAIGADAAQTMIDAATELLPGLPDIPNLPNTPSTPSTPRIPSDPWKIPNFPSLNSLLSPLTSLLTGSGATGTPRPPGSGGFALNADSAQTLPIMLALGALVAVKVLKKD